MPRVSSRACLTFSAVQGGVGTVQGRPADSMLRRQQGPESSAQHGAVMRGGAAMPHVAPLQHVLPNTGMP